MSSTRSRHRRRVIMHLDPHDFLRWGRTRVRRTARWAPTQGAWVRYEISLDEVLADLNYGQD